MPKGRRSYKGFKNRIGEDQYKYNYEDEYGRPRMGGHTLVWQNAPKTAQSNKSSPFKTAVQRAVNYKAKGDMGGPSLKTPQKFPIRAGKKRSTHYKDQ